MLHLKLVERFGLENVNIAFFYLIQLGLLLMAVGCVVGGAFIAAPVFLVYGQLIVFALMYVTKE